MDTKRTVEDSIRALEMMANNAKLPAHVRTELKRLVSAIDDRMTSLELALGELQHSVGDETLCGGERVRKRDSSGRLYAPRMNAAIVRAKELTRS